MSSGSSVEHRIAVAHERAQRGDERRVGQLALAQLDAVAAAARASPSAAARASQLGHEPALADARLADDERERRLPGGGVGERGLELRQLERAARPAACDVTPVAMTLRIAERAGSGRCARAPVLGGLDDAQHLGDAVGHDQALDVRGRDVALARHRRRAASPPARPSTPCRTARSGSGGSCRSGAAWRPRTARRACRTRPGRRRTRSRSGRTSPCARRSSGSSGRGRRTAFSNCSCGSSMSSPIDGTPASRAPRLPASMIPGPPPVMIEKPARAEHRGGLARLRVHRVVARRARRAEDRDRLADVRELARSRPAAPPGSAAARAASSSWETIAGVSASSSSSSDDVGGRGWVRRNSSSSASVQSSRRRGGLVVGAGPSVQGSGAGLMDDCPQPRRSIVWIAMRWAWTAIAVVAGAGCAAPRRPWRCPTGATRGRRSSPPTLDRRTART